MAMLATRYETAPGAVVAVNPSEPPEIAKACAAMDALGAHADVLSADDRRQFDQQGFVYLRQVVSPDQLDALRERCATLLASEGAAAGREVHQEAGAPRLSALSHKGPEFDWCHFNPRLLGAARYALDGDVACSSLNYRDALPGRGLQALHTDGPVCPVPESGGRFPWHGLGCILLLDDVSAPAPRAPAARCSSSPDLRTDPHPWCCWQFAPSNGATRIVPVSHASLADPFTAMEDALAPHPQEVLVQGKGGDAFMYVSAATARQPLHKSSRVF